MSAYYDTLDTNAISLIDNKHLKQLNSLHIFSFECMQSIDTISQKFDSISSLTISNSIKFENISDGNLLMQNIGKLNRLKKLNLFIESDSSILSNNAFKQLKSCRNLIALQIESSRLTTDSIEAISRFLPQLLKSDLTYVGFDGDSDQCISWIQHFKYLECIKLSTTPEITDKSTINIINSCHSLRYIDLSRSQLISEPNLLACVEFAIKKTSQKMNIDFAHHLKNHFQPFERIIPKNVTVKYRSLKFSKF